MDRDELREETDEWVAEGIISREQADAILARYDGDDGARLAVVVSLMGAVLVGVGVLWYLAGNWETLPRWFRSAVLVLAPVAFAGGGHALERGRTPKVGHALWFLGVAFVGPSAFLLTDLWGIAPDPEWLLLAWAALALPAGHVRASRPTTALGLTVAAAAVGLLAGPTDVPLAVGFFGVVVLALGIDYRGGGRTRTRREERARVGDAYRLVGVALVILTLLSMALQEFRYDQVTVEATAVTVATALGAAAGVGWTWWLERAGRASRAEGGWTTAGAVALVVAAGGIALVPTVPAFAALTLVHGCLLVVLVATVVVAVETNATALVNVATLGFFGQVLAFLGSTVADAVSGPAALVLVGVVLLLVALALERGRRELLERMRGRDRSPGESSNGSDG